jgi:hypothetical protein
MGIRIYPAGIANNHRPIYRFLLNNEGSFLMASIRHGNGEKCYRLMDSTRSPKAVYSEYIIDKMLDSGFLQKKDGMITISENGRASIGPQEDSGTIKKSYAFGKTNVYNKGDIVYHKGTPEMICKIECRTASPAGEDCFFVNTKYPSLHFSKLRHAKPSEVKKLKNKKVFLIKKTDTK